MAKQRGPQSVQNRHIYTRASYLYQAAQYLASRQHVSTPLSVQSTVIEEASVASATDDSSTQRSDQKAFGTSQNLSRQLLTDMRIVTQKLVIRQTPDLKRTICKFCDTLQIEGQTSFSVIENSSKGGKKPWADVLAIKCQTCGHVKRFPVSAKRQKRRPFRDEVQGGKKGENMSVDSVT